MNRYQPPFRPWQDEALCPAVVHYLATNPAANGIGSVQALRLGDEIRDYGCPAGPVL